MAIPKGITKIIKITVADALDTINASFSKSYTVQDWESLTDDNVAKTVLVHIASNLDGPSGVYEVIDFQFSYQQIINALVTPHLTGVSVGDIASVGNGDDQSFLAVTLNRVVS